MTILHRSGTGFSQFINPMPVRRRQPDGGGIVAESHKVFGVPITLFSNSQIYNETDVFFLLFAQGIEN
jgi:hypothetical protein